MPEPPGQRGYIVDGPRVAPVSVDLADAVVQGVRAGFGVLSLGLEVALRTLGESPATLPRQGGRRMPVSGVADILVGTAWGAARLSGRIAATGARIAAPMMGLVLQPPLVPRRLQPASRMQVMSARWQRDRPETLRTLGLLSATAFPAAVDAVLDQVDIEQAANAVLDRVDVEQVATAVLDRVDLTSVVSIVLEQLDVTEVAIKLLNQVDLDEVAIKLLNQVDVDKVAIKLLNQVDVDEVAAQLLEQLDLDELAIRLLSRLDMDEVAAQLLSQLNVDAVATQLLNQLDLTRLVLERVDLQRVVGGALEGLDLTAVVVEQVDLGGVVAVALQQVDLTEIVMQQVDLVGVAEYVVDAIDLPEIIRDSTGSVASEAVVGIRMQGIDADAAVGRVVDRMLRRRRQGSAEEAPGTSHVSTGPADPPARTPV